MPDPAHTPFPADSAAPRPPARARGAGPLALAFTLLSLALAITWQNLPEGVQRSALGLDPIANPEPLPFDIADPAPMQAKVHVRSGYEMEAIATGAGAQFFAQGQTAVDDASFTPGDRMIGAVLAGELESPDAALDRLADIEAELDREDAAADPAATGRAARLAEYKQNHRDALRDDLPLFRTIYEQGPEALTADQRDRIANRYRYVGRLALVHGLDDDDPQRAEVIRGGTLIRLLGLGLFFLVALAAATAGLVILIMTLVSMGSGKFRPRAPAPHVHGGALLETVGIFSLCFFILSAGGTLLAEHYPRFAAIQIPLQWALIIIPIWPLLRGWRPGDWRTALGLTSGRGFIREIGAGIVGYLAALPVFIAGVIFLFLVMLLEGAILGERPAPPDNPIIELLVDANWATILIIASLVCVWAPLCEEMVFRGALFSHIRNRFGWVVAALLSTIAFAYMHSYGPLMLWPILALGFSFATIRWWRGSLIACVTAHALHNTSVACMMVLAVGLFPA